MNTSPTQHVIGALGAAFSRGRLPFARQLMLAGWVVVIALIIGCQTSPSYKTLTAVGKSAQVAVDEYFALVIDGKVRTNDVPRIAHLYEQFQAAFRVAEAAAEFAPTARASTNIIVQGAAVVAAVAAAREAR